MSGRAVLHTPVDVAVAELAGRQAGMVSTAQLRALGIGRSGVYERVRRGWLHPRYRQVYSVGHTSFAANAHLWAAILACGGPEAAVLSHRSAAALWELLPSPSGKVDVITLRESYSRKAIRVHRTRTLEPTDITTRDGIPLTTPTRTLIDLVDQLPAQRLERVCHRAEILRLLDSTAIQARLASLPGRRSTRLRAALMTLGAGPQPTRSELEERFLSLIAKFDLPRPLTNQLVAGHAASSGPTTSSSSRRTAPPPTSPHPPSSTTAPATPSCCSPATGSSASPGVRSRSSRSRLPGS